MEPMCKKFEIFIRISLRNRSQCLNTSTMHRSPQIGWFSKNKNWISWHCPVKTVWIMRHMYRRVKDKPLYPENNLNSAKNQACHGRSRCSGTCVVSERYCAWVRLGFYAEIRIIFGILRTKGNTRSELVYNSDKPFQRPLLCCLTFEYFYGKFYHFCFFLESALKFIYSYPQSDVYVHEYLYIYNSTRKCFYSNHILHYRYCIIICSGFNKIKNCSTD